MRVFPTVIASNAISRTAEFDCLSYQPDATNRGDSRHQEQAAIELKTRRRRAYLVVRGLTQASILAMAAVAVSPILMRLLSLSPGDGAGPVWLRALGPLWAFAAAGYIATNVLRHHWLTEDSSSARGELG